MPPIDLDMVPNEVGALHKIEREVAAQLQDATAEKDKLCSLLRERTQSRYRGGARDLDILRQRSRRPDGNGVAELHRDVEEVRGHSR